MNPVEQYGREAVTRCRLCGSEATPRFKVALAWTRELVSRMRLKRLFFRHAHGARSSEAEWGSPKRADALGRRP